MVRHHEEARRIGEGSFSRIPARIGMAVRRDDRQITHVLVETPGDGPRRGIGGKEPVLVIEHFGLAPWRLLACCLKAKASMEAAPSQVPTGMLEDKS